MADCDRSRTGSVVQSPAASARAAFHHRFSLGKLRVWGRFVRSPVEIRKHGSTGGRICQNCVRRGTIEGWKNGPGTRVAEALAVARIGNRSHVPVAGVSPILSFTKQGRDSVETPSKNAEARGGHPLAVRICTNPRTQKN